MSILEIDNLTVGYRGAEGWRDAVRDVTLRVAPGERLGVVGESGSGKSTLALAALRFLGAGGAIRGGTVRLRGIDLGALSPDALRAVWARDVRLVPQNPLAALNPSLRVGDQVAEAILQSAPRPITPAEARRQALDLLRLVRLADPERVARGYPHELSGGMQQRALIAMALHGDPALLILDEPTTSLDVTTEAAILALLADLTNRSRERATLFISHNLGIVARMCNRVAVLYAGELVEVAPTAALFAAPLHPYTAGLIGSLPRPGMRHTLRPLRPIPGAIPRLDNLPRGCVFHPRCPLALDRCRAERPPLEAPAPDRQVRCFRWHEVERGALAGAEEADAMPLSETSRAAAEPVLSLRGVEKQFRLRRSLADRLARRPPRAVRAVDGVDLQLGRGRTLGVVGESGSGKTTLARCVVGLEERTGGEISLVDVPLAPGLEQRAPAVLRRIQMVFQNPQEALNPYLTVGETLRRPLMRLGGLTRAEADRRVARLLDAVKLDPGYAARYPAQLSGGERQRVAIARAFAAEPDLVLLDESVSALDVSVQAAVLNLLSELRRRNGTTYLFITHDLGVVSYLADDVAVVYLGQVLEEGPVEAVLRPPMHPYTEVLLSALPALPPDPPRAPIALEGDIPAPTAMPSGCRFHTRCHRLLGPICAQEEPPWRDAGDGHRIRCHIPLEELGRLQRSREEEGYFGF
ncbi:MAG: ABC transporter ATP-binding protein [Oscillochloridaceae bacterium]|nr:ABC transporter ATP-binding protein [Chloroflexaceae bacterium]MDW8389108.1 ABC transporter ATP-binding protein [Oscillochloridaceae bacterium]